MVHRPASACAAFVRGRLRLLETVSFTGVPRYQGIDREGHQILTYVEGWVPHGVEQGGWTDMQLCDAATLLRAFHDATADITLAGNDEVVCHNDCAPWNNVSSRGVRRP